jgi:hypothetical protein
MALLKRLQDICEIEVQISRQIEDELIEIDNKYLKLIAEASLLTFKASGFENPSGAFFLDELWTRRVIPAILRQNPFMIQDVINAINNYASVNYQGNKRIQKLIQIENSKSTYH